jgi:hypothetical protein
MSGRHTRRAIIASVVPPYDGPRCPAWHPTKGHCRSRCLLDISGGRERLCMTCYSLWPADVTERRPLPALVPRSPWFLPWGACPPTALNALRPILADNARDPKKQSEKTEGEWWNHDR